ncbi:hypothetical protein [Neobacillus sp. PS2-9]|uniref:hypothetical protein n=1 Tax=Neobacillus sp. PS2-9 TaxID=3070676 RepID=UPI0027DF22B7|nr:hypothetical protein [Neobacillus sp. PS2-9]WML56551.1 hypothetical protein RCG25_16625 [Neobacillus sp. PS2-9]
MKKLKYSIVLSLIILLSLFSFGHLSYAKNIDSGYKSEKLTKQEKNFLKEVTGHTDEEINQLPLEVAKQLVKDGALIQDSNSQLVSFEGENNTQGDVTTMSTISPTTMKLAGTVYKVISDRTNDDKFYIYGNFQWLKSPFYTLVDKMTFGFPSSSGLYLPTSSGSITQHQHRYSQDPQGNGNWVDYAIDYSPSDWEPSAGVAGEFDLRASTDFTLHKGYMGQYVYVPKVNNGTINIKIEYGHKLYSGSPTVSVYPAGLAITPTSSVDTASYALTLTY